VSDIRKEDYFSHSHLTFIRYLFKPRYIEVAIKVLSQELDPLVDLAAEDFTREVTFMGLIRHPNVLQFLGAGIDPTGHPYIVTELMTQGSLKSILRDHGKPLEWTARLQFAQDIASGMAYLHDIGTVHRDIKV
jgi:serine/threonine protein kinase